MAKLTEQMIAAVEEKAAAFYADPEKGRATGYQPVQAWGWAPPLVGQERERIPQRSEYGAWLYGVAQKDLPAGTWRFQQVVGEGPGSAGIILLR